MKFKLLNRQPKTFAVILNSGDPVISTLEQFAQQHSIRTAQFTAIGALNNAQLGFFDFKIRDYKRIKIEEQVEVLSLVGDITIYKNKAKVHAHIVLGKENGTAHGGHLLEAVVHPTLEVILTESPAYLERQLDEAIGIPLIKI
jgi:predicted DNA-binding protein with PD1-like motif